MNGSHEVMKRAVEGRGAKIVAHELRVSLPLLYKWCQEPASDDHPDGSGALNPLDRVKKIVEVTGDDALLHWLCQQSGGFYVKNPRVGTSLDAWRDTPKVLKEFSDLLEALSVTIKDSRVQAEEARKIRKEWEDVKSYGEALARACEQAVR